ncbi:Protein MAIN-LIKE 1 [Glycine max]|nr:Protein MAIN-LIKE 1 [Glycine max]
MVAADAGADVHPSGSDTGADVHPPGADTSVKAVVDELEGFPGGSTDPSVLTKYAEHVAASVWTEEEHPELKLSSHGRKLQKLGRPVPIIEGLVASTGLSPLIACSVDTGDRGLISSFVERWHRETSSFYLPVGEVTITLDDVASLLHLPIVGDFHTFQPLHVDEVALMLVDLLLVSHQRQPGSRQGIVMDHTYAYLGYEIYISARHWTTATHAYLLHLLGCTLFANKSATYVHVVFLDALRDLSQTGRYAWGAAALVHKYDHLNDACISTSRQLAGYITLLQCWIYEHFSLVVECIADLDYDEVSPRACRWIATKKTMKTIYTKTYR